MSLDAARAAGRKTSERGDDVAQAANDAVVAMLVRVQTAAAVAATEAARADSGKGVVGERTADAAAVRQAMAGPVAQAANDLAKLVYGQILDAIAAGWEAGAAEQDALISGRRIRAERPDDASLARVPVQGHSPREIALHQAAVWEFAAAGVMGQAGAMGDPAIIAPGMAQAAIAAGNRAGQAVGDAFATGASLARQAVAGALGRG